MTYTTAVYPSAVAETPSRPRPGTRPADEDLYRRYAELRQRLEQADEGQRAGLEKQLIAARNRIVDANVGLLWKIARELGQKFHRPAEELIGLGFEGMIRAIDKYDPDRGKFSTLAWITVRRAILGPLVRESKRGRHFRQEPSDGLELLAADPHDEDGERANREEIDVLLSSLSEREHHILRGLMSGQTLAEMAAEEGISRQRLQQISSRAARKVRAAEKSSHN